MYGLGRVRLRTRIEEVLELVGLTDRADDRIDTYSGGMKRRSNIGAGLLHEPDLIILDEPAVGVDPQSRDAILTGVEN
ncbi:ATP-binding cassette domain-containing protein [Rhodococcus sp. BGS-1C]|nr:ATP-binding cassette domain-containing protein [Rhodococcus sp. I2R]